MKRFLAILMVVTLLVAIVPTAFASGAVSNSKVTVYRVKTNGSRLYVHSEANEKKSTRKGSLANGAAFKILQKSGDMYKIKAFKSGMTGWVAKRWTAKNAYAKVTTKNQGLNVRKGPGTGYALKGSLPKGAKNVLVKYVSGGWAYVKKGSLEGWSCIQGGYSYKLLTWNA